MEIIMATLRKFDTCSTTKTYSSYKGAEAAFLKKYADVDIAFIVVKLDEDNCDNPKHYGRYIPAALGEKAISFGIHFNFHVIG
jgi:hypothetical protein